MNEARRAAPRAASQLALGGLVVATSLAALAFHGVDDPLSPQSIANVHFAESGSYVEALSRYNRVWPPLYPSVLWLFARAGIPAAQANLLLFVVTLGLLSPPGRRLRRVLGIIRRAARLEREAPLAERWEMARR